MNPQFDKPNLPPPLPEFGPLPPAPSPEQQVPQQPETVPAAPERAVQPPAPVASTPPAAPSGPQQGSMAASDVSNTTPVSTPVMADDNDLIEKEWVTKAKQIVENTKSDPYRQSKDMTVFRADYMQKRYNKTIKLPE